LEWTLALFHVPPSVFVLFPATLGKVGVAIFFVVSGFCIHLSHQRSREKGYVTFFIRRFFRLYPAYLVAVLIYAFAVSDTALDFVNARWISLGDLGSHLLMVHNLVNRYCFSEFGMRTLQGVMFVAHPGSDLPNWYNQFPLLYWYSWSIGAALAEAFLKGEPLPFRKLSPWLCPALFFVCFFFRPLYPFCFPLGALATARILSGLLARPSVVLPTKGWKGFFWENLRWAGLVSYSAYLLHGLVRVEVPDLLQRFFPTREFHPFFVSAICICTWFLCLGMSSLSFALIEQPGIALGKRLIKRISAMTAAPAAPAPKLVEGA
jgi:peptidoglycan/LPS O-acetylase OafA/YrhL